MVNNANIREKKNRILSAHPERLRSPYKKKANCNQWDTTANGGLGKGHCLFRHYTVNCFPWLIREVGDKDYLLLRQLKNPFAYKPDLRPALRKRKVDYILL